MKGFKKFLCFAMTFVMAFVMFETTAHAAPIPPTTTSVTIHKIVSTSQLVLKDTYGKWLSATDIQNLWPGSDAVEAKKGVVQFTVWKISDADGSKVEDFQNKTISELNEISTSNGFEPANVLNGEPNNFGNGTYYVRETNSPRSLENSIGVPFIMELPVLNPDNNDAYLKTLDLYPKNAVKAPSIDKDVEVKDQDHASYDMGKSFNYLIYPEVPKGIQDYTVFNVSDTLASTLDYLGNIAVTYKGNALNKGIDYFVTEESPSGTPGGNFTITFTKEGLSGLDSSITGKTLEISFQARINSTATMGQEIYNDAVLTYNNGYTDNNYTVDVPKDKQPEVHTGGRKFIKIDNVAQKYLEALSTATFCVTNNLDGKYMIKDSTTGEVSWTSDPKLATIIHVSNDGTFEVTGLAYGNYTLEEINAPTGYIKMDNLAFTIDKYSYGNQTEGSIDTTTKVINVKKPAIPQTGGIGAIIFLAAGLTLMGAAVFALKRKEHPEK